MADRIRSEEQRRSLAARATTRLGATIAVLSTPVLGVLLAQTTVASGSDVWHALAGAPSLALTTVSLGEVLAVAAGAVGSATAAYLTLMSLLLLASPRSSRARRTALRLTPAAWRRVVGAAAASALSAGMAVPAMASPSASDAGWVSEPVEQTETSTHRPDHPPQLPPPAAPGSTNPEQDLPEPSHSASTPPASGATLESAVDAPYVVAAGDSLWSITADALSGEIGDGESVDDVGRVAHAWPELYEENKETIGPDASLIHPGAELTIPEGWAR